MKRISGVITVTLLAVILLLSAAVPAGASRIGAGCQYSLWIADDGLMWGVGNNATGVLGDGTKTNRTSPVLVGSFGGWKSVSAGYYSAFGIRTDGSLWGWGRNDSGQIGIGTTTARLTPARIASPYTFTMVAAGGEHTLAIRSDGTLWAWGKNGHGQLGNGSRKSSAYPVRIGTYTDWVWVSAGVNHSTATRADGSSYTWGCNYDGAIGNGAVVDVYDTDEPHLYDVISPYQVCGPNVSDRLYAGYYFTMARWHPASVNAGKLTAWGSNRFGQLADGNWQVVSDSTPGAISSTSTFTAVAPGGMHVLALRGDGVLEGWGRSDSGQVGINSLEVAVKAPTVLTGITNVTAVASGGDHTLALRSGDSMLWGWGSDGYGQLAVSGASVWKVPRPLVSLKLAYLGTPVASSINYGSIVRPYGKLLPKHTASVKVEFFRWSGTSWVLKKTLYGTMSQTTTYTKWATAYKPTAKGKWYVRASHTDAQHLTSRSPSRIFYVK